MLNYRNRHKEFQYTQLQLGKDSDDDDGEETELFVRKAPFKEIPTEEKIVEEGDTLQSISIRYHCPIAEIKRLNNIHKENEIFARNTIKVPARPFSNILAGVHMSGKSSPEGPAGSSKAAAPNVIDTTILEDKLINFDSFTDPISSSLNAVIFNSNINKTCDIQGVEPVDILDEEVQLLPNAADVSVVNDPALPVVSRLNCSGADADISWIALILCVVVLIVAVPLIYIFYIAEHPEEYHHKKHVNLT